MFCEDLQLCGEPAPGLPCDDTEAFLVEQLERLYTPREPERTEDWMFRKLRLSANQSADRAGEPVDIRNVPHARIIFDFLRDPYAEELNIMKSSAAALSTSCIIAAIHMLTEDPGNILYLITNREESIKLSKNVWQPFLRQVFGREVDTEEQGNLHLHLAGCEIFSGSPTGGLMRNKQVKYLFEDESDTMSDEVLGSGEDLEGSQMARTKNAGLRKIIRLSTPIYAYDKKRPGVTQPRTRIHRNFLRGDQREFRCPCPACRIPHAFHEDDFHCERAKGLDGAYDLDLVELETEWHCPSCGHVVHEGLEKRDMVNDPEAGWIATAKGESRRVWSAKHTDWCSLIGNATWGAIKKELIRTAGTIKNADVRRNHLAEPEDIHSTGEARTDESILRHCGTHDRGTCPVIPWVVGLVSDVQKGEDGVSDLRFPWMKAALHYRPDGRVDTYVIDWGEVLEFDDLLMRSTDGKLHGLYTHPIPLRLSTATAQAYRERFQRDAPPHVYCNRGIIDSGYRARGRTAGQDDSDAREESVYAFSLRSCDSGRFLFCPVKGRAGQQINALTVDSKVIVRGYEVPLLHYDDPAFKRDLYNIRLAADPARPSALARDRGRIIFPRRDHMDETIIGHLKSERYTQIETKNAAGKPIIVNHWTTEGPNDLGDCLKWYLVLEEVLRISLLRGQAQQQAA